MDPIETPSHFDLGHRVADAETRFVREERPAAAWLRQRRYCLELGALIAGVVALVLLWLA